MKNQKSKTENVSVGDLKNGYIYGYIYNEGNADKTKGYICLFCNARFDEDVIHSWKKLLINAKKAVKLHIRDEHGEVFNCLLNDKTQTGLTDTQTEFLKNYYSGMNDKEIAEKMNISMSTVRFQRHNFREKAKQAKTVLALNELLEVQESKEKAWKEQSVKSTKPADENTKMLETLFESLSPLVLKTFFDLGKKKEEKRLLILQTIAQQFEKGQKYTEKEVNAVLKEIYEEDYVTIRRSLIDYGFMDRTGDCREYWVKEAAK